MPMSEPSFELMFGSEFTESLLADKLVIVFSRDLDELIEISGASLFCFEDIVVIYT